MKRDGNSAEKSVAKNEDESRKHMSRDFPTKERVIMGGLGQPQWRICSLRSRDVEVCLDIGLSALQLHQNMGVQ